MVVCKFFQQGNCRYGQNCRFDHIYGSKYSYHASSQSSPSTPASVTDDQLINQVLLDVQAALKGRQWSLSCYSPYKEKPNFPGLADLSMEEARLFIYEAKANNTLEQAVAYMNNLVKETIHKYEQLLQPTPTIINVLRSLYKGEQVVTSPFSDTPSSGFDNSSAATSIFRSAVQSGSVFGQSPTNATPSIFSSHPTSPVFGQPAPTSASVFNQSPGFGQNTNQSPSVFGQPSQDNAKSLFAQATQNVFGPSQSSNIFASASPDTAKSIFAQATQSAFSGDQRSKNPASVFGEANQSVFGKPVSQPPDPFGQHKDPFGQHTDPFGQRADPFAQNKDPFGQQKNPFGQPSDPFGQQSVLQVADSSIYSDINTLSQEHIEAFKSDEFKLGFIPEVPPPYSLCF